MKVILAIVRQTFGWHKADDRISISQLVKLTGLTRQGVINGVARALEDGFLDRQPVGQSFTYSLKVVNEVDQPLVNEVDQFQPQASQQDRPELVNETDHQLVNEVDPQKKESKEIKERGKTQQRGTRLPDDFAISESMREWGKRYVPHLDLDNALLEFVDYWRGVPGTRGTKLDWPATWRNRMRELEARAASRNGNGYVRASKSDRTQQAVENLIARYEQQQS